MIKRGFSRYITIRNKSDSKAFNFTIITVDFDITKSQIINSGVIWLITGFKAYSILLITKFQV